MRIQHFFDERTSTLTYLVWDEDSRQAVLIDPVLDFDPASGRTWYESAERVGDAIRKEGLDLAWALDTHPHADHLSSLPWFQEEFGARTGIGKGITRVQETWKEIFHLPEDFPTDGRQWDLLLEDGQILEAGPLKVEALLTEGHTPASMSYRIGDALFVGDLLFMPDSGTARTDFPGGDAGQMYDSVQRLYRLPDATRVFTCHDYQPGGRELRFQSTVGEEKKENIHIHEGVSREEFIALRRRLEDGKPLPKLLFPSVQVNIRGGRLPEPEANGVAYLKIPLNRF